MAHPRQFARPVMSAAASLERHQTSGLMLKELQHFPARNSAAEQLLNFRVCPMRLKDILRNIQTNYSNLAHGRLLS